MWQLRKQKKISLHELSKKTGYADNTIASWENGFTSPTLNDLADWAQTLEVKIDFIIEVANV
jgi:transcriptional regulator with XRE-family HTH domain